MSEQEVINAIKLLQKYQMETVEIEAKTAEKDVPKKCYDTISAFANTRGGIIIFGINEENNFKEQAIYKGNDIQNKIASLCTDSMEPKLRPQFLSLEYNNVPLLAMKIDEIPQSQKPCYYKPAGIKNGSYVRVGDSDFPITDYELYCYQSYKDNIQEDLRPYKTCIIGRFGPRKNIKLFIKDKKRKTEFF